MDIKLSAILLTILVGGAFFSPVIFAVFFGLARLYDKKTEKKKNAKSEEK